MRSPSEGGQAVPVDRGWPAVLWQDRASLTTKGDTSPDHALAVDRFPTGSMYHYERSFKVSHETAKSLRNGTAVVVVHGIDYNKNGKYAGRLPAGASLQLAGHAPDRFHVSVKAR